jgi:cytochrome c
LVVLALTAGATGWTAAQGAPPRRSVWDGVYTDAQAKRGAESYQYSCATCHSPDLEGDAGRDVPALYGEEFVAGWSKQSLGALFDLLKKTMPKDSPGSLKAESYADIVAYLLQANEFPAGAGELAADPAALERIAIDATPPVK